MSKKLKVDKKIEKNGSVFNDNYKEEMFLEKFFEGEKSHQ